MRKCLTNKLMSQYSLKGKAGKGKAGKIPFEGLPFYKIIIRKLHLFVSDIFCVNNLPCNSIFVHKPLKCKDQKDPNGHQLDIYLLFFNTTKLKMQVGKFSTSAKLICFLKQAQNYYK